MTSISTISPPAKAAALSAGAIKSGSFFSVAAILTALVSVSGLISAFFGLRASLDLSRTKREKRLVIRNVSLFMRFAGMYAAAMLVLKHLALQDQQNALNYTIAAHLLVFGFVATYVWLVINMFTSTQTLRVQERLFRPEAYSRPVDQPWARQRQYKNQLCLLGVPLVHVQFGGIEPNAPPAFGWIAAGSHARGTICVGRFSDCSCKCWYYRYWTNIPKLLQDAWV